MRQTPAGTFGMALWWAWFAALFFPRPMAAGSFGAEVTGMRAALMAGLVFGSLAHAAARRARARRDASGKGGQAGVEALAFDVACCLAMSVADVGFALASLGAVGTPVLLAGLVAGAAGGGAVYLGLLVEAAGAGRRQAGRELGRAALLGGAGALALALLGMAAPLGSDMLCALLPWAVLATKAAGAAREAAPAPSPAGSARATPMFAAYALVFGVLYGFMLVLALHQAVQGAELAPALLDVLSAAGLAGAGAAVHALYRRRDEPGYLRLLRLVTLLMAAGLLALAFLGSRWAGVATALVALGYILYWLLFNVAWVDMSEREGLPVASVAAWGLALSAVGIAAGTALAGAGCGLWAQDGRALALTCVGLCAVLMLAGTFMLDTKVFEDMGGMVRPAPARPPETDALIARVDALACEFGLTAREREIALMLARGRNPRAIEERLGISVNTVRTHVHHIYEKCGVHSDQELIDLLEDAAPDAGDARA